MKGRMLRYLDGLRSGKPINIDGDMVLSLNHRRVAQSARYLYSATDTFDFAREILKEHGELPCRRDAHRGGACAATTTKHARGHAPRYFGSVDHCMLTIEEIKTPTEA